MSIIMSYLQKLKAIIILIFLCLNSTAFSQEKIVKKLPNKLDVFLLNNKSDEKETLFYLLIRAGAVNETDLQLGYAHLLEHLIFKKGKRFKKQSVTDFFKQQGLQVGKHYNATTNYDYTLYQIKIPSDADVDLQRKIFLFFADVLDGLLLTNNDLETERKIVLAEKNIREKPTEIFEFKLGKSLYKSRLPIGTEQSIMQATTENIRAFYNRWYQPQNSAVFVVGDIDLPQTDRIVTEVLSEISNKNDCAFQKESIFENLENNTIFIRQNKALENTKTTVLLALKQSETLDKNKSLKKVFNAILEDRIVKNLTKDSFYNSFFYHYFLSDVGYFTISLNTNKSQKALEIIFTELERLQKFGISEQELEFYKNKIRNKKHLKNFSNSFIIDKVVSSFIQNNIFEYQVKNDITELNLVTVSDIDAYKNLFFSNLKNLIFVEKSTEQITKDSIKSVFEEIGKQKIEPFYFVEKTKQQKQNITQKELKIEKLMPQKPIETNYFSNLDITKLSYENGINVLLKPIKNGSKEFSIIATANGGYTNIPNNDFYKFETAESYVGLGGIANLTNSEKDDYLSDKSFGLSLTISDFERLIHAHTSQKDQAEFFKFLYATLTSTKPNKSEFDKVIDEEIHALQNKSFKPLIDDKDKLIAVLSGDYFPDRRTSKTEKDYRALDVFEMQKFYERAFKFANKWNYVIVGDFFVDSIAPVLDMYIGNLKSTKNPMKNPAFDYQNLPKYQRLKSHNANKNYVLVLYSDYSSKNLTDNILFSMYESYLRLKITELLREKNGLVYSPTVEMQTKMTDNPVAMIKIEYYCDKTMFQKSKEIIHKYLSEIIENELNELVFNQVKEQVKLEYQKVFSSQNIYLWSSALIKNVHNIEDLNDINDIFVRITKKRFNDFIIRLRENQRTKIIEVN